MISLIIPTLNGGELFGRVLERLAGQRLDQPWELLVYDSGSTDGTPEVAKQFGARVTRVRQEDFDHGGTRSRAAAAAKGEILVFLTQDAFPADEHAVARLIKPFAGRDDIAATYGRQLPAPDADPFATHLRLHNYPAASSLRCWGDRLHHGFRTVFISNSFAAWRREVLAAHGYFPENQLFGEDSCALAKLLENGYCVKYVSEARVLHSHNYSVLQDFRRYFDIGVFHACNRTMLQNFGSPSGAGRRFVVSEMSALIHGGKWYLLPESILRSGCKYIAYHLGTRYKKLPAGLPPLLSMQPNWWAKMANKVAHRS